MRLKVAKELKAIAAPISLYPHQKKFVQSRAFSLGVSVSRYFQMLLEDDKRNGTAKRILAKQINAA